MTVRVCFLMLVGNPLHLLPSLHLVNLVDRHLAEVAVECVAGVVAEADQFLPERVTLRTFDGLALFIVHLAVTPFLITKFLAPNFDLARGAAYDFVEPLGLKDGRNGEVFGEAENDAVDLLAVPKAHRDGLVRLLNEVFG